MPKVVESEIPLPHDYNPRPYQLSFWEFMQAGGLRAILVWHRRSGKDKSTFNYTISAMTQRRGIYYYFFPTFNQGRKILWDGIDRDGKLLHHFPDELIANKNETEMKVTLTNGSIFQIVGTDNYNQIRGTNPIGCVFSEFSEQDPGAWGVVRPILGENGGWAVFCSTPKGQNHLYDLYKAALNERSWFCEIKTIDDTGIFTRADVDKEISLGMDPDFAMQEYYCSFTVSQAGSYFGKQLADAKERICRVPWEPILPVHTAWDLGMDDSTAIWFFQRYKFEVRMIEYFENSGEGLGYYIDHLKRMRYAYGRHKAPHDIMVKEMGTGRTRYETARSLGLTFDVVPKQSKEDSIQAARTLIPVCWFDAEKCKRGLDALRQYHKEYDEATRTYKKQPHHDWSSHGSDAYQIAALGSRLGLADDGPRRPRTAQMDFDPLNYEKQQWALTKDAETYFDPFGGR